MLKTHCSAINERALDQFLLARAAGCGMYDLWPPSCLGESPQNTFPDCDGSLAAYVLACTVCMQDWYFYEPYATKCSLHWYFPSALWVKHGETLFKLLDSCQLYCHTGKAQGPRLIQRKVEPSWPGVKTLINTHMHSFLMQQQADKAAVCSLSPFCLQLSFTLLHNAPWSGFPADLHFTMVRQLYDYKTLFSSFGFNYTLTLRSRKTSLESWSNTVDGRSTVQPVLKLQK